MLELEHTEDTTMLILEVNEKKQAPLGQRIRPVSMCFFSLRKGITTSCLARETLTIPKTLTVSRFGTGISQPKNA